MEDYCVKISNKHNNDSIAVVCGGSYDSKYINIIKDKNYKPNNDIDPFEQLDTSDFVKKYKLLNRIQQKKIVESLKNDENIDHLIPGIGNKYKNLCKNSLKIDSGKFVILPNVKSERVFIAGASGVGKSCLTSMYIHEYKQLFPKREVYLFSTHENEKAYQHHNINQILLDEKFAAEKYNLTDLQNSLIIFDDCDNLQNSKLSSKITLLNNDLISNGRKYNIHVVTLSHQLMDYKRTRLLLTEANKVVFFLGSGKYHINRYLRVYCGFDNDQIKKILKLRSRWVCLGFTIPNYFISEHEIGILN